MTMQHHDQYPLSPSLTDMSKAASIDGGGLQTPDGPPPQYSAPPQAAYMYPQPAGHMYSPPAANMNAPQPANMYAQPPANVYHQQAPSQPGMQNNQTSQTNVVYVGAPQPPVVIAQTMLTPPSYLGWSIFNFLCCFWPLGLAAIIFSCKVGSARSPEEARRYSLMAKNLNIAADVIAPVLVAIIIGTVLGTGAAAVTASSGYQMSLYYYSPSSYSYYYSPSSYSYYYSALTSYSYRTTYSYLTYYSYYNVLSGTTYNVYTSYGYRYATGYQYEQKLSYYG